MACYHITYKVENGVEGYIPNVVAESISDAIDNVKLRLHNLYFGREFEVEEVFEQENPVFAV
jgi:hypothetical protein